jgi:hypothetical protein
MSVACSASVGRARVAAVEGLCDGAGQGGSAAQLGAAWTRASGQSKARNIDFLILTHSLAPIEMQPGIGMTARADSSVIVAPRAREA